MKFSDFVCSDAVTTSLSAVDRDGVIAELVDTLVAAEELSADHRDSVVSATIAREELGTTGIGNGFAIPHAKHPAVDRVVATVGVGDAGVEFGSLDGRPTRVFFLLVSPPDAPQDHLARARDRLETSPGRTLPTVPLAGANTLGRAGRIE